MQPSAPLITLFVSGNSLCGFEATRTQNLYDKTFSVNVQQNQIAIGVG
jgi:hypothetical protein